MAIAQVLHHAVSSYALWIGATFLLDVLLSLSRYKINWQTCLLDTTCTTNVEHHIFFWKNLTPSRLLIFVNIIRKCNCVSAKSQNVYTEHICKSIHWQFITFDLLFTISIISKKSAVTRDTTCLCFQYFSLPNLNQTMKPSHLYTSQSVVGCKLLNGIIQYSCMEASVFVSPHIYPGVSFHLSSVICITTHHSYSGYGDTMLRPQGLLLDSLAWFCFLLEFHDARADFFDREDNKEYV